MERAATPTLSHEPFTLRRLMREYFFVVAKNVVGWLFILASPILGVTLPGPGGIPVFLVGFALVTLPGKRRITTRLMRGRRFDLSDPAFVGLTTTAAVIVTAGVVGYLAWGFFRQIEAFLKSYGLGAGVVVATVAVALAVTWLVLWVALHLGNWLIGKMPWVRRKSRGYLRKLGIRLLPPRPRDVAGAEGEILDLSDTSRRRLGRVWAFAAPWLARMLAYGLALGLLVFIAVPLVGSPEASAAVVRAASPLTLAASVAALVLYLLTLRPLVWRQTMAMLGHRLPTAAAIRTWAVGEVAAYFPADMVPLVSRAYLLRPWRISAREAREGRLWELALAVSAGLAAAGGLLVVAAVLPAGLRRLPAWAMLAIGVGLLIAATAAANPATLRRWGNALAAWLDVHGLRRQPNWAAAQAVLWPAAAGAMLYGLAGAAVAGEALRLPPGELPVVGGAYLLAWCAGAVAWIVPAGLGVRELAFYLLLLGFLPELEGFRGEAERAAALAVAAVLLRLWSILGEAAAAILAAWLPATGR